MGTEVGWHNDEIKKAGGEMHGLGDGRHGRHGTIEGVGRGTEEAEMAWKREQACMDEGMGLHGITHHFSME